MGEDMLVEKKPVEPHCQRHSSVISSCSEDAESETTSGYPPTPDSEELAEELEYGPGIVNKLRTRFLTISLKQNRGSNIRRSCSMENLLDQDDTCIKSQPESQKGLGHPWNNLKRAKSMDTLLMDLSSEPVRDLTRETKLGKRGLNRNVQSICDEELPKPDTVKTYKRMFEPAESRRGSYCRRPPVLRASAKSTTSSKIVMSPNGKVNGVGRNNSRYSAKPSPSAKPKSEQILNGISKKPVSNGSLNNSQNGGHVVKATPLKINGLRKGRSSENLNSINNLLNKSEAHLVPESEVITNGINGHHMNTTCSKVEETVCHFNKNITPQSEKTSLKPKVPPNKPSLKVPPSFQKSEDSARKDKNSPLKFKPMLMNGLKKVSEPGNTSEILNIIESKFGNRCKSPVENNSKSGLKPPSPVNRFREVKLKPTNCDLKSPTTKPEISPIPIVNDKRKSDVKPISASKPVFVENKILENGVEAVSGNENVEKSPKLNDKVEENSLISLENCDSNEELKPLSPVKVNGINNSSSYNNNNNGIKSPSIGKVKSEIKTLFEFKSREDIKQPVPTSTINSVQTTTGKKDGDIPNPTTDKPNGTVVTPEKIIFETSKMTTSTPDKTDSAKQEFPSKMEKNLVFKTQNESLNEQAKTNHKTISPIPTPVKSENRFLDAKSSKKSLSPSSSSMVFDFRGKDVVSHVAKNPAPFGCKSISTPRKKDSKEASDDEEDDFVDYSTPPPSGVTFEGENIKIGRGSILSKRNKELKITFDDDVDGNTFIYPSETSLMEDSDSYPDPPSPVSKRPGSPPPCSKLKANTALAGSGLSAYTPSVLRTVENFEPGMFRQTDASPSDEGWKRPHSSGTGEENSEDPHMLKPAGPDHIAAWSVSAGPTSDLLF